ncbi:MAG: hypothetical protein RL885_08105 [Planctomycetota bacterium]
MLAIYALLAVCPSAAQLQEPIAAEPWKDILIEMEAEDRTPLEAKLSLPADAEGKVPVVFYLHGAGPRTYDNPFPTVDEEGEQSVGKYLDFFASELTGRGVAFFRMSKRGCHAREEPPWMKVDRAIFSKATLSVLLADYEVALDSLRKRPEIDPNRIVLIGSSEGTRLAPQLALRSPKGLLGVAMLGYAADNAHDTIVWQMTDGPWRNISHLIPAARDGALTKDEHQAFLEAMPALAAQLPFQPVDVDGDGQWTSADFEKLNAPRLQATLNAVEQGDDDFLWKNLLNLSSAYCRGWWDAEPNAETLLKLDLPLAIFHGDLDGTCRVEGVLETQELLREAERENLEVHLYDDANHDLNWTSGVTGESVPAPFRDVFALITRWTKPGEK